MRTPTNFADPGKRLVAAILDGLIIGFAASIIMFVAAIPMIGGIAAAAGTENFDDGPGAGIMMGGIAIFMLVAFCMWLAVIAYFVLSHSGKHQATIGKRAMKIYVTDENGDRLSKGKAFLRYLGRMVNGFTMYIGYIIILFTEKKQGLHDIIASTLVLDGNIPQDDDDDGLETL